MIQKNMTVQKVKSIVHFKDFYFIYCFLKNHMKEIQRWNVGMTMLIMTHRMYSAVSFWVCLCSTNETLGFLFKNFSEASGPEIIRLEKLGFFRRVSLVEKG